MNWTDFIVFLEKQWERKSTLAILLIVVFVGLVAFFTKFELLKLATWQWGIILLFLVVLFFTWRMTTKIPNAKKGKAGILIAIIPENDNDKNTIENDFIQIMRDNAVSDGNLQIISVPLPLAKKIVDQEAATNFCKKSNAKMLLWGYVKKRKISDIECRVLRLHSTIIHPPIPGEFSAILAHNMGQLMPLNINVDCNNEYLCFEVTAKWMHLAAKFFVTQIILLEGNIELAEKNLLDLWGSVNFSNNIPQLKKLKEHVRISLASLYDALAHKEYCEWKKYHISSKLVSTETLLDKANTFTTPTYARLLLKAICLFHNRRQIDSAIREIRKCSKINDPCWKYSLAFLHAYKGNLNYAQRFYKQAFAGELPQGQLLDIEIFIQDILEKEPDKKQLYFCLGLINYQMKLDLQSAEKYFTNFLIACADNEKYQKQLFEAKNILDNIQTFVTEICE